MDSNKRIFMTFMFTRTYYKSFNEAYALNIRQVPIICISLSYQSIKVMKTNMICILLYTSTISTIYLLLCPRTGLHISTIYLPLSSHRYTHLSHISAISTIYLTLCPRTSLYICTISTIYLPLCPRTGLHVSTISTIYLPLSSHRLTHLYHLPSLLSSHRFTHLYHLPSRLSSHRFTPLTSAHCQKNGRASVSQETLVHDFMPLEKGMVPFSVTWTRRLTLWTKKCLVSFHCFIKLFTLLDQNVHTWTLVSVSIHVSKVGYFEIGKNSMIQFFFWMMLYRPPWSYIIVDVFPSVCEPLVPFRQLLFKNNFAGVSLTLNARISLFQLEYTLLKIRIRQHLDIQCTTPFWKCADVKKCCTCPHGQTISFWRNFDDQFWRAMKRCLLKVLVLLNTVVYSIRLSHIKLCSYAGLNVKACLKKYKCAVWHFRIWQGNHRTQTYAWNSLRNSE